MTKTVSPFIENTEGILTHNGEIKVAKGGVKQKILNIGDEGNVLVMGRKNALQSYEHAKKN